MIIRLRISGSEVSDDNSKKEILMTLREYDVVISTEDIDENVKVGTKGVVVMVLDKIREIYEIEFFDANKDTIEVMEVSGTKLYR